MYANQPWSIRQYSGFATAEESNAFFRRNPRRRADGAFHRFRFADPARL
ncbi:MAG: methylmalonyl-CoA mutase family protein [Methylovirgula sp.]